MWKWMEGRRCALFLTFMILALIILLVNMSGEDRLISIPENYRKIIPRNFFTTNNELESRQSFNGSEQWDIGEKTLVIIVNSGRPNKNRRQLIRDTWGSVKNYEGWSIIDLRFLLGQGQKTENVSISQDLVTEQNDYHDMIMGEFLDTYRNLTFKSIMGYKWLAQEYPSVHAVFKCDDDVVLNIFELIKFLNMNPEFPNSSDYYGDAKVTGPIRSPKTHKWYVSVEDWSKSKYPTYCSGLGFLTTMIVIKKVLGELPNVPRRISLDDVFLSGIVPDSYNTKVKDKNEMIRRLKIPKRIWHFDANSISNQERLMSWYNGKNTTDTQNLNKNYPWLSFLIVSLHSSGILWELGIKS